MQKQTLIFEDPTQVAKAFADFLEEWLTDKSSVTIALSGGSTPKLLFKLLADSYANKINWNKVHFFWGDERCVPPSDEDSNYKMTKELLLDKIDIPEGNIHRVKGENDPEAEALRYGAIINDQLEYENALPAFDLILLGMGDDGHTASIFPDQMHLMKADETCRVGIHPASGQKRVTITGPVINNARKVVFLVTGPSKKEKVAQILNKKEGWEQFPAAKIQPLNGSLTWYLDEAAAKKIS